MKLLKFALTCLIGIGCMLPQLSLAAQQYVADRSDALGGDSLQADSMHGGFMQGKRLASSKHALPLVNPALLALYAPKFESISVRMPSLPVLEAMGKDNDQILDQLDALREAYQGLGYGINSSNVTVFYTRYFDDVLLESAQGNIATPVNLAANLPSGITELVSPSVDVGVTVSDFGVAVSAPLSIVNMPILVGISPKLQRIDTYDYLPSGNYVRSGNNLGGGDFSNAKYRYDEVNFNVDVNLAIEPVPGIILGLSGHNLISHKVDMPLASGRSFTYRIEPQFSAGLAYYGEDASLSTDIDLNAYRRFDELDNTQYWRVAGEVKATDWLALRLGYRYGLTDTTGHIYSLGTGFEFGQAFSVDFTGMLGNDDVIGGVLQTSYHF